MYVDLKSLSSFWDLLLNESLNAVLISINNKTDNDYAEMPEANYSEATGFIIITVKLINRFEW